jgi:hypothetical protein
VGDEGGGQGRPELAKAFDGTRRPPRSSPPSSRPSAASASSPSASSRTRRSSAGTPSGATSSSSRRSTRRWSRSSSWSAATSRPTTTIPKTIGALAGRHRGRRAGDPRGPRGRGARGDAGGQRDQPEDGAAHAGPPLLHRPGRQCPRAAGADRHRPKLVARARSTSPDDVIFLRYNELRVLMGDPGRHGRAGDRQPAQRRTRALVPTSTPAGSGSARRPRASSPSRTSTCGASPRSSTASRARSPARSGHRRLAGHRRRHRPGRPARGPVRRGPLGRHPGLPDDQPGVGRAVHQDRRR